MTRLYCAQPRGSDPSYRPRRWIADWEIAREYLLAARGQWELGVMPPLYDPVDTIAWYIPQAETFAIDRQLWVPGETARIVPFLARIGEELDDSCGGSEE